MLEVRSGSLRGVDRAKIWMVQGALTNIVVRHSGEETNEQGAPLTDVTCAHVLSQVARWDGGTCRFESHLQKWGAGADAGPEYTNLAERVVWRAVHSLIREIPIQTVVSTLGRASFRITSRGDRILSRAELSWEEQRMRPLLDAGASVESLVVAAGGHPNAYRSLLALRWLRGISPPSPPRHVCALLVRKRQELHRRATPHQLLELPSHASAGDARRALRRLARDIHPDRMAAAGVPSALREASNDVLRALVQAAAVF